MKKVFSLIATAILAVGFTACSQSDLLEGNGFSSSATSNDNAIQFGTYLSKTQTTRAGNYGAINDGVLKQSGYGFGVFAYSTGNTDYSAYRTQNDPSATDRFPNFMYNQKVTWNGSKWEYTPVKYWPNEIAGTASADDDQNNDSANDPAIGSGDHGGKVSFFAYAPYADATVTAVTSIDGQATTGYDGTTSGIIALSGNAFNGGASDASAVNEKYKYSDPYVKYRISADHEKQVDLLWGTANSSSENVINETTQAGVQASTYEDVDGAGSPIGTRPTENVNADLTKQKTTGTINFKFKHALAKIGGSSTTNIDNSHDDDPNTAVNGLMVVLDLDKDGAETGGSLEAYSGTPTATTKYNTKVTINEITLNSEKQLTAAGKTAIQTNSTFDYANTDYTEDLVSEGLLNLATGVWSDLKNTTPRTRTQTITKSDQKVSGSEDNTKDAILATEIAEPANAPAKTQAGFESLPLGVTTVPKNVYKNEKMPFVFIPGSMPIITISIDYTVRTYDANLKNAFSEVHQKITKRLYILDEIKLNKHYSILMHIGLTSVKFTAIVSDWEADSNDENVTGKTDDVLTAEEAVERVYLPINVAQLQTAAVQTPANLSFDWNEDGYKNLGYATLTYSDGTQHTTKDVNDAGQFITPLIAWTSTGATIVKVETAEGGYNKGDLKITWGGKNVGTTNKSTTITFSYGNQTAQLEQRATQPCGPLQVTSSGSPFAKEGNTYAFISEVKAGNGEGDPQTGWKVLYETADPAVYSETAKPDWITSIVSESGTDYGKITLTENATGSDRSKKIKLIKNDASSEVITITQSGD